MKEGKPVSEDVELIIMDMKTRGLSVSRISGYTMVSIHPMHLVLGSHWQGNY